MKGWKEKGESVVRSKRKKRKQDVEEDYLGYHDIRYELPTYIRLVNFIDG